MAIGCRSLSAAWLGGVSLSAASAGGYSIYDTVNPTGDKQLLGSSYIFNPPKLTSHKSENNHCFENLFKKNLELDTERTYGCRVAELNIWNSGERFKNKQISVDYLTFTKKLTIRKGNEGLQIVRLINNREGPILYTQVTHYKRNSDEWQEQQTYVAAWKLNISSGSDKIKNILLGNKHLHFEADNNPWYNGESNSLQAKDSSFEQEEKLTEVWKEQKSGSWIWIENKELHDKIPIWHGLSYAFKNERGITKTWHTQNLQTYFPSHENTASIQDSQKYLNKLYNFTTSQGKWIDTKNFCDYSYKRNIGQDNLEDLKLFCAKPITNS